MKRPTLTFILFAILFTACSLFDDDGPKDPRDYNWSIDTLKHSDPTTFQLDMRRIWASSSDNIYLVGHSSSGNGAMWHYNGETWLIVPIIQLYGGTINNANHSLTDIIGFSKDDIWAVGRKSGNKSMYDAFIIHYDGWKWTEISPPDTSWLLAIGGVNRNEIWVGPYGGGIFKYNGLKWEEEKINFSKPAQSGSYTDRLYAKSNQSTYSLFLDKGDGAGLSYSEKILLKRNDSHWEEIFRYEGSGGLWVNEEGIPFVGGYQVRKFINTNFEIVGDIPSGFSISHLYGVNDGIIFACGRYLPENIGNILFYNGKEWVELLEEPIGGVIFSDIWTDGKTVVAVGSIENPNLNTIILRGE